jgi:uncharacterized lipoprotein YddW (UPF0748 family)
MRRAGTILVAALLSLAVSPHLAACAAGSQSNATKKKSTKSTAPAAKSPAKPSQKSGTKKSSAATALRDTAESSRTKLDAVPSRAEELRGIWITTDGPRSDEEWDAIMRTLKARGLNAAFVRVAQGGKAIYPSKVVAQDVWASEAEGDQLERAVTAAHAHGIQLHAWKVCFNMGSERARPPKSAPLKFYQRMADDDRLVRDPSGAQGNWLNPSDPRNQDLEVRVAAEVVQKYDVDGYHLDYIRYPDESSPSFPGDFPFHYGDVSRREFEKSLGCAVKNWPSDVISGPLKMQYEAWERDNITRVVARIRTELKAKRPGTLFSAAVWRKVHRYRSVLKQDWPRWGRDGLVDFLVLMAYEKDLAEFRSVVERDFSHVCGRVPFVVGIGSWQILQPEAVVDQVQAAREIGADGFVLFSLNDPTHKNSDGKTVTAKGLVDRQLAALAAGATRTRAVPNLGGPHLEFLLSHDDVVARRYKTYAAEAGHVNQLTIRLPRVPGASGELRLAVSVEDVAGRKYGETLQLRLKPGGEQTIPLVAAVKSVRPVVRGAIGQGTAARPFVLRGPIVEPVSRSEIAELRARKLPPQFASSGTRVGVYFNGLGSDGLVEALKTAKGVAAATIYRLDAAHLAKLDVLVLPHLIDVTDLTPEVAKTLRTWVEGGGRLILTRDAVGLRWHPRLFPEVGKGTKLVAAPATQTAVALRGLANGSKFEHEGTDHVQLSAGPAGKVLATEAKFGKPVVVAGSVGKGLVVLDGMMPGNDDEAPATSNSMRLLVALVHYRG